MTLRGAQLSLHYISTTNRGDDLRAIEWIVFRLFNEKVLEVVLRFLSLRLEVQEEAPDYLGESRLAVSTGQSSRPTFIL